jgi:ABC-type transporter Mla MlaB component
MPILVRWDADYTMTLHLAGTLDTRCIPDVERALESARRLQTSVVLDLGKLQLIDRPTMEYLIDLMQGDIKSVVNCPEYVEQWLHRELLDEQ